MTDTEINIETNIKTNNDLTKSLDFLKYLVKLNIDDVSNFMTFYDLKQKILSEYSNQYSLILYIVDKNYGKISCFHKTNYVNARNEKVIESIQKHLNNKNKTTDIIYDVNNYGFYISINDLIGG